VGITLAGGNVLIAGATPAPDVPFTPGTLSPKNLGTGFTSGAYLAAANFSATAAAGTPAIACVLDAANLEHVRAIAPYQAISLFGANLASSTGVAITFGGNPAQLLYVSSSQINVVVPPNSSPVMQVTINGMSIQRQFPGTTSNLNLFANLTSNEVACPNDIANGFQPLAINADGSLNSCAHPAKFGAAVSFFVEGAGSPNGSAPPAELTGLQAWIGGCAAPVENTSLTNGFVYQVDVQMPASTSCAGQYNSSSATFDVTFTNNGAAVGPLVVPPPGGPIINFTQGQPMPMIVWAAP